MSNRKEDLRDLFIFMIKPNLCVYLPEAQFRSKAVVQRDRQSKLRHHWPTLCEETKHVSPT
jgi:hypothetical protein